MTGLLAIVFFAWMIGAAIMAILQTDLLQSALGLSLLSLGAVGQFFLLQAPDVALTEAAIGVAASSFVMLMGVRQLGRAEKKDLQ
ncbi:Na(+)/H(+) antiporter subunit B [Thiocystis violascens]|uniref:Putative subunit of the multisubunit Na+/H+ antiporter n=1 Tax=Thiocystis violascens (strain ATCC 17096 / DSM 198 / 6111) TaxID=765911 RepID=I3Y7W3_THIV6|nr:hydrogenase subunit MbhD domain-containing protein [Thiocystis violascens]AFL73081.1 putative subunit of the multisubunit Na+/H+ antiporter [Thiocystis violascens DSM 198]